MSKLKCCGCKKRFDAESMIDLPAGKFHSMNCAMDYAKKIQEKNRKTVIKKQKDQKAKVRKQKRDLDRENLTWQHNQTQPVFNKLRRLQELLWFREQGLEPTCISCGNPLGNDQWCNGHFKTVGAHGALRYDFKNSYLQHNVRCNRGLSGDIYGTKTTHGYLQGLKNRFGDEEAQKIIDYCETANYTKKWKWWELEEMRKEFNKEIRRLEKILNN